MVSDHRQHGDNLQCASAQTDGSGTENDFDVRAVSIRNIVKTFQEVLSP